MLIGKFVACVPTKAHSVAHARLAPIRTQCSSIRDLFRGCKTDSRANWDTMFAYDPAGFFEKGPKLENNSVTDAAYASLLIGAVTPLHP